MKTKLFTKNLSLGLLMALVLVFGVSGIADALTLTPRSDTIMEKGEDDPDFEISFSVGLKSDTTPIYDDNRKLIKDSLTTGGEANHRIDSQGYLVTVIDGKDYRDTKSDTRDNLPPAPPTPAAPSDAGDTTYAAYVVYKKVSSSQYIAYGDGAIFANSSKSAFSSDGYPLHYHTPSFTYTPDGGTAKTAPAKTTSQIKIREEYFVDRVPKSHRYHYNDEAITISVAKNGTALGAEATDMTVRLKSGSTSYQVNLINTIPTVRSTPPLTISNASLWEGGGIRSLPSSITLICKSSAEGVYTVTIKDVTPANDFPANAPETLEQRTLIFTLRVTEGRSTTDYRVQALRSDGATTPYLRVDTGKDLETIHDDFKVTEGADGTLDADDNPELRYKVISGNGTLFAAANSAADPYRGPSQDITVHYTAKVFLNTNGTNNEVSVSIAGRDRQTHPATIVYEYSGDSPARTTPRDGNTAPRQAQLTLLSTGENQGTTRSVTVRALNTAGVAVSGVSVTLTGPTGVLFSPTTLTTTTTGAPATSTVTLPSTPGPYLLRATDLGGTYNPGTLTLRIAALGTLLLELVGEQVNGSQTVQVSARTAAGSPATTPVTVTLRGAGISRTVNVTGSQRVPISLPTTSGTLTASASEYRDVTLRLPARSTTTTDTTTTDTTTTDTTTTDTTTAGAPNSISIVGSGTREGTANTALDASLIVRVLDANGNAVPDTRVIFRVVSGQGRLTPPGTRGIGRAFIDETDSSGYARATYTPISASSTVEAEVRGVTRRGTFSITASGGAATPTPPGTSTTPSRTISPVVHVGAAQRPPMLWVDGGKIYAFVGASVEEFGSGIENAMNLAIGGDKVYWTEKTGDSSGTINRANLDGTGVMELTSILAVPMGIAVDTANSKLYWTNSRGRIQRANLDGSIIRNVLENLTMPLDIAIAGNGNLYWTHSNGGVGFVNPTGPKQVRNISNGADASGSLAIANGKVYWTQRSGESGGTVHSANLDGSGAKQLASIFATPIGIAVDTARSKLFWTNSRGRVQGSALDGSGIQNVVDGLGSPTDMVISNSIKAPVATTTPTTPTTTASKSKYDLNGDGAVNSTDVDLILLAVSAGIKLAKYDVNGDTKVDIKDVMAVNANLDKGAAAAPTLLGRKFSALEIDRLQEQIDLLIATGDRSPAAIKTLIYLQQLIAMARPEKTQLLANYPNPFNPETWIPYELATDTDVKITIYNAQGVVIRTLQLGQQSAGYYTDRERAAYWDGRNALGEQVASGIYFYQLETDEMSSLRKMVILK